MQATFSDPQGPRWVHALLQAPAAVLVLIALFGGLSWTAIGILLALAVVASSSVALAPLRQKEPVPATLTLGPGYVRVRATRLRSPTVHAREITGASTARTDSGFALTLARKDRDTPTTIEVATEAEVDKLRLALGIGHGGHGSLAWWSTPTSSQRSAFGGRIAAALATLAVVGTVAAADAIGGVTTIVAVLACMAGFFAIPLGLLLSALGASRGTFPDIQMTAAGIRLATTRGPFLLPYAYYAGFEHEGDMLAFKVPAPWGVVRVPVNAPIRGSGLTPADVELLRVQLDAAALRARGYGRSKEEVVGRVETLRRGRESARDWLARLDIVGQTLTTGAGYRGQSLDAEDLWTVLEDPDAEPDLRTAAARVLRHLQDERVRVRIDAAAAAIRDETTNRRVRVAAEAPLEEAAAELDELEGHTAARMRA